MSTFIKTVFLLFCFLILPLIHTATVYAGDGSVTSWSIDSNFSDPSCSGSGIAVTGNLGGAGQHTLIFSPTANTRGRCQVHAFGKGKVCNSSTNFGGTVAAGTSISYTFSTCSDGGNSTSWSITGDYDVIGCTPQGTETQNLSCPAGQTGSITQQRTSTCPGPTWGPWTTTSNTCVNTCTPLGTETQTIACPAGQVGSITQQRTSTCPGPTWGGWTTTSSNCVTLPTLTVTNGPCTVTPQLTYTPTINLNWSASSPPAGTYHWDIAPTSQSLLYSGSTNATSQAVSGYGTGGQYTVFSNNTNYQLRVRAQIGATTYDSNIATITTGSCVIPVATGTISASPTNCTRLAGQTCNSTISWNSNQGTSVKVTAVRLSNNIPFDFAAANAPNGTKVANFIDEPIRFTLEDTNILGQSKILDQVNVTTTTVNSPQFFSASVTNSQCGSPGNASANFRFTPSQYADRYLVAIYDETTSSWKRNQYYSIASLNPFFNGTEYVMTISDLTPLHTYSFYVRAENTLAAGFSPNDFRYNDNSNVGNWTTDPRKFIPTSNCYRPTPFTLATPSNICADINQPRISANFLKSANANFIQGLRINQTTGMVDISLAQPHTYFFPATTPELPTGNYTIGQSDSVTTGNNYIFYVVSYNLNLASFPNDYYIYSNVSRTGNVTAADPYFTGPVTALDCEIPIVDIKVKQEGGSSFVDGPIQMPSGFKATFNWNVSHATNSCLARDDWSGSKPFSGSILTAQLNSPPTSRLMYSLRCTNGNLPAAISQRDQIDTAIVNILPLITPWLQTQGGGDVHSNTNINIRGGP